MLIRRLARGRKTIRFLLAAVAAADLSVAASPALTAAPTIALIDSDPATGTAVAIGEPLFLRVRYRSEEPIHILPAGRYLGKRVGDIGLDAEELFPAGSGEATVWLSYSRGVRIDQVRLRLYSANMARLGEARFPLSAEWGGASVERPSGPRASKPWVAELTAAQRARLDERKATGSSGIDFVAVVLFLGVPAYVLLQLALGVWAEGGWRKAAWLPAIVMVPILGFTVLAFAAQSNLWPMALILASPLATLYLAALGACLVLRRLLRAD